MRRPFVFTLAAIVAMALVVAVADVPARAEDGPTSPGQTATQPIEAPPTFVYPMAILPFQERGKEVTDQGGKCTDILFANLVTNPEIYLVEREELKKLLDEMKLSAAGLTDPRQSTQIGQLTGAKVLITGSIFQAGNNVYVVAKLIGTETSRVFGASAKGKLSDELDSIVGALAKEVIAELKKDDGKLMPATKPLEDRIGALAAAIGKDTPRPSVYIGVTERHIGQPAADPAVETELAKICQQLGFKVIDRLQGDKADADILLVGSGFSQFATRHGDFTSVKARVELKALNRETGRVLAVDRQTAVAADLAELVAAKAALQEATEKIASRLLPEMLKPRAEAGAGGK